MEAVSIIIPARNSSATLKRCILAANQAGDSVAEIIVVDDASTDSSGEIALQMGCTVIRNHSRQGAAKSRNQGSREAKGVWLLFIDSDIEIPNGSADQMLDFLREQKISAAIGLLQKKTEQLNFSSKYENYYMHRHYYIHDYRMPIFYTSFAMIRKTIFQESGGFNENYAGASIEDMELGQRLVACGIDIFLNKLVQVNHLKAFTACQLLKTNFKKAVGTMKIRLRNRSKKIPAKALVAPPSKFVLGIPLTGLLLLLAMGAICLKSPHLAMAACIIPCIILTLNRDWLKFLFLEEGGLFTVKAAGFLFINFLVYGLGIVYASISFALGRRY